MSDIATRASTGAICTGRDALYEDVPAFTIEPGQLIVDHWTSSRGGGTLGVAFVHEVTGPARWDGSVEPKWALPCRRDYYFGTRPPLALPVLCAPARRPASDSQLASHGGPHQEGP